eukprot:CAMPEP_0202446954 /NCGR_PEP_ID=MMETSP1360-20130828/5558_1 /ASSEMBLY_ACC=CAM_ASM_000848 /TAXON_ID=515479 /ORGANISM="Licmophora paradoxa, Strain CCMP2313" /LENGTH=506 /DNA_ID=CAMNT_0049063745 /DNA_START=52 /DNA_END=1572 /DNA_ORIENTATION=-
MTEVNALTLIKNVYSTILLIFSITIIMGLIFTEQTTLSSDVHPAMAFIVMWVAVLWLSVVEGGQASFVGLAPVSKELFKDSHPIAYKCAEACHTGDNLDRYLLGRQFMVIFIVFAINTAGGPVGGAELWGLPQWVTDIFLVTGFAMILFTCMVGQLNSQVNASHCMLDYCNNYINLFTLYVARGIELSGLVHASYLVQFLVAALAGRKIESNEEPRTGIQLMFFWFRCILSLVILAACLAITFEALFKGQTTMWDGVPEAVSVILFFLLMSVVGLLEGMQIAFFAVAKLRPEDRGDNVFAMKTCELLFRGEGHNLPGFMIGRQLCVVSCFFIIARVTSIDIAEGEENVFGVTDRTQEFLNFGFCGALITTILGSISWQLVASAFPIAMLSNPFTYVFLNICLLLEATGLCSGAWVLAAIHKKIAGFQRDEVYIGTAEERAAQDAKDTSDNINGGVGHPRKLPGFADNAPQSLKKLMTNDPTVVDYITSVFGAGAKTEEKDVEAGEE